jgi:hypothetical protein
MIEYASEHLEIVIERSRNGQKFGHEQYRLLVDKSHPDHEIWRRRITEMATGEIQPDPPVISVKSERIVISTGNGGMVTIPLEESLRLNKEMRECPHYEKRGCNTCGKAFCKIGKGESGERMNSQYGLVSTWDCYHCLRPDVELYAINAYKKI